MRYLESYLCITKFKHNEKKVFQNVQLTNQLLYKLCYQETTSRKDIILLVIETSLWYILWLKIVKKFTNFFNKPMATYISNIWLCFCIIGAVEMTDSGSCDWRYLAYWGLICMQQWSGLSLVQVVACLLLDTKPSHEPMRTYFQSQQCARTSVKRWIKIQNIFPWNLKVMSANFIHFVEASIGPWWIGLLQTDAARR